jgi:membrane-bound serine protease (ClpP class)
MAMKRFALFAVLAISLLFAARVSAQAPPSSAPIMLADITGVIGPPAAHHVRNAIEQAEAQNAEALILEINTPGGLETSTREIVQDILHSSVPVIGYVAPSGARAASAGTYILYATHVAAMAPGTNVGAATPVQLPNGGAPGAAPAEETAPTNADALDRKAVNDSAAFLRSLADLRGRNAEWGERAVRFGEALSASEAVERHVVELIASDRDDLLRQLDGRTVAMPGGERTLATRGRSVERIEPSLITRMLGVIANPNVAFLLMMIGIYGLIFEFMNPGHVAPGVIGAVCLVLGLYALNTLPLNYAGLALILLGVAFIVAEAFTPSFGILGIGGVLAFIIGAAMLVDTDIPEYRLSWGVIVGVGALTFGLVAIMVGYTLRTYRRPVATGREALIGARVKVLDWSGGAGHVWVASERWNAEGPDGLAPGGWARVKSVNALKLHVAAEPSGETS